MNILVQCFACMLATMFFGMLLGQPRQTLLHTVLIGLNAYVLYLLLDGSVLAFFLCGLLAGLLCELTARLKGMATTLFLISAIIPVVPGLGLYRTMMFVAAADYPHALQVGTETLVGIGAIALGLTIATAIFANIRFPSTNNERNEQGDLHARPDHQR